MSSMNLGQSVSLTVVKKPVKCSQCGELRTQVSRCENCGCTKPFEGEQNVPKADEPVQAERSSKA